MIPANSVLLNGTSIRAASGHYVVDSDENSMNISFMNGTTDKELVDRALMYADPRTLTTVACGSSDGNNIMVRNTRVNSFSFDDTPWFAAFVNPTDVFGKLQDAPIYTPDVDHCYMKVQKEDSYENNKGTSDDNKSKYEHDKSSPMYGYSELSIPTPPTTEDTSDTDVDVVTLPDGRQLPSVPEIVPVRRNQTRRYPKKVQRTVPTRKATKNIRAPSSSRSRKRRKLDTPSSTDDESERRAIHNTSERHRREMQRYRLQNLRKLLPIIRDNPKASKLTIIDGATAFIKQLQPASESKVMERLKLLQEVSENQSKLSSTVSECFQKWEQTPGVDLTKRPTWLNPCYANISSKHSCIMSSEESES